MKVKLILRSGFAFAHSGYAITPSEPGYVQSKLGMGGQSKFAMIKVEAGILWIGAEMALII